MSAKPPIPLEHRPWFKRPIFIWYSLLMLPGLIILAFSPPKTATDAIVLPNYQSMGIIHSIDWPSEKVMRLTFLMVD